MGEIAAPDGQVVCSTITFRHRSLEEALQLIHSLGFREIDLGALPGVCDHVPAVLDDAAIANVAAEVRASGLAVRSINADVGDLNAPLDAAAQHARDLHIEALIKLALATGSGAIVLPCGRQNHEPIIDLETDLDLVAGQLHRAANTVHAAGIALWVEALHSLRLCYDAARATALVSRLDLARVGVVYDISHVVSAGDEPRAYLDAIRAGIVHVHLRDAVRGNIHLSIGRGDVDFADLIDALTTADFHGRYALELETRDVAEADRPAATARAAGYISELLTTARV